MMTVNGDPEGYRVPILRIRDFLLVSIQVELDDRMALRLQDDLTKKISDTGAQGVIVDISAVQMIDSFIGRVLSESAAMAGLLGAETVVVGMQPAVAITLVELGLPLRGVLTALDMDDALALLERRTGVEKGAPHGRRSRR